MLDEALKTVKAEGGAEPPLAPVRGLRDFLPGEQAERQRVLSILRGVFERYGFLPVDTPAMESWETLAMKGAGGSEILKETYGLKDRGDRRLGLRNDLTVPLARVMANNPNLPKPFKRYQTGPVWRDGPIRLGRYREFVQCDADTVGAPVGLADAELLAMAAEAYAALGLDVVIRLNNRKVLWALLESARVPEDKRGDAMLSLDKLQKVGLEGVVKELSTERGLPLESVNALVGVLNSLARAKGDDETLAALESALAAVPAGAEGVRELRDLLALIARFGPKLRASVVLDPWLARGLDYYTGPVFEAYLRDDKVGRAVGGGGRYDELIGRLLGSPEKVPAAGFSFGLDVLVDAIRLTGKAPGDDAPGPVKVFVIPIGPEARDRCIECVTRIRRAGLNASMDLLGRGPSKNLEAASKLRAPYAVLVGRQELDQNKVKLKDLRTGEEKLLALETALELLTDEQQMGKL
jgi:histidyl-tRNA synthetase